MRMKCDGPSTNHRGTAVDDEASSNYRGTAVKLRHADFEAFGKCCGGAATNFEDEPSSNYRGVAVKLRHADLEASSSRGDGAAENPHDEPSSNHRGTVVNKLRSSLPVRRTLPVNILHLLRLVFFQRLPSCLVMKYFCPPVSHMHLLRPVNVLTILHEATYPKVLTPSDDIASSA